MSLEDGVWVTTPPSAPKSGGSIFNIVEGSFVLKDTIRFLPVSPKIAALAQYFEAVFPSVLFFFVGFPSPLSPLLVPFPPFHRCLVVRHFVLSVNSSG